MPLVLQRTYSALRYFTFFAFMVVSYIALLVIFNSLKSQSWKNIDNIVLWNPSGVFNSFSNIIFAFYVQCNIPDSYLELEEKTTAKFKGVLFRTQILVTIIMGSISVFGYINFVNTPEVFNLGDVLLFYGRSPTVVIVFFLIHLKPIYFH